MYRHLPSHRDDDRRVLGPDRDPGSWQLRANDEIDRDLVVIRALGGGERYEVFEAWDRRLFARVAAKGLRPHKVAEEGSRFALRRGADLGGRLAHPNLVRR